MRLCVWGDLAWSKESWLHARSGSSLSKTRAPQWRHSSLALLLPSSASHCFTAVHSVGLFHYIEQWCVATMESRPTKISTTSSHYSFFFHYNFLVFLLSGGVFLLLLLLPVVFYPSCLAAGLGGTINRTSFTLGSPATATPDWSLIIYTLTETNLID